jgi:ATPase subunit of ABC transporter with duplicated ATPase domains
LDAQADALKLFQGAAIVASQNRAFCNSFCKELWVCDDQKVKCLKGEGGNNAGGGGAAFSEIMEGYVAKEAGSGGISGSSVNLNVKHSTLKAIASSDKNKTNSRGKILAKTKRSGLL